MKTNLLVCILTAAVALPLAAQIPSPALVVLNKTDNELAIVDPANGKVVGRVPTGEAPHEVAVSADGKLAFVSNYGRTVPGTTISVIDLAARKELHRVDLAPLGRAHGIAVHDGKVYFSAQNSKAIGRYDPATNKVDWSMGTGQDGTHMVVVTRDGNHIYTTNKGSNTVTFFESYDFNDPVSKIKFMDWRATHLTVGKGVEGIDLSADEKTLVVGDGGSPKFWFIDTATRQVTGSVDTGKKAINRVKLTPDGSLVLASDIATGDLTIARTSDKSIVKQIHLGRSAEGILITPDGSRAYVGMESDNNVAIVDLKTMTQSGRLDTGKGPDGMAWIPAK